jgi:glycosyltransferase involved in cell wall biosynthesis
VSPRLVARLVRALRVWRKPARRWVTIALKAPVAGDVIRVYYGHERVPGRSEIAHGGRVKFQALDEAFPNTSSGFNVLYVGSSYLPADARVLVRLARRRGAKIMVNQNGVAYPGWHGPGWERANRRHRDVLRHADYVVYQSAFCKLSADRFLGEPRGGCEVLHNPVDTQRFTPNNERPARALTLLLGGNQYQRYRFETGVRAFALVAERVPEARLLVTGALSWTQRTEPGAAAVDARKLLDELGVRERVVFTGSYSQQDAPGLIRQADIFLHTKYNDPCPGAVIEALACGLPVVYSASGGVPELVGDDAGIGVPAPLDFEQDHPPDPFALAEAILAVVERLDQLAAIARRRAVERFDVRPWIARHREIFMDVLS